MGDSAMHLYVTRAEKETIQPCQDCGESVDGKRQCNKCFGHLCPETCGVWARTRSVCTACYSDVGTPYPCPSLIVYHLTLGHYIFFSTVSERRCGDRWWHLRTSTKRCPCSWCPSYPPSLPSPPLPPSPSVQTSHPLHFSRYFIQRRR